MDATTDHRNGTARPAPPAVDRPELISRLEIESLCRSAVVDAQRDHNPQRQRDSVDEDWTSCVEALQSLQQLAAIGSRPPDFTRWPRYSRRIARLAARGVLFLSRFLIIQQSQFNAAVLNTMHDFALRMSRFRGSQRASARRTELELQGRIEALEQRMDALQREFRRTGMARIDT